jgi:GGDEF domain-containing protein
VLLEDTPDSLSTGERLRAVLAPPFELAGTRRTVRASFGMAEVGPADGPTTADGLLARADAAMYAAKRATKRVVDAPSAAESTTRAASSA